MRIFILSALLAFSATAADLAGGWTHSVAIREGEVWTWGDNTYGQLGQPDAGRSLHPRPVAGLHNVVAVSASWHTLALTADGKVYAWGRNTYGQLGNGEFGLGKQQPVPVQIKGLEDIVAIAAGWDHSLALTRNGLVYAWGSRSHGQLGDGIRETGHPSPTPVVLADLKNITAIAAGGQHSLALRENGVLYAWGSNWQGQLGNGKQGKDTHSATPKPVIGADKQGTLANITGIAAGAQHSLAVDKDGNVYAWGYNGTGQIPSDTRGGFWDHRGQRRVSIPALALKERMKGKTINALSVAAGYESTYVLEKTGNVLSSGWNMYGELGTGSRDSRNRDQLQTVTASKPFVWENPPPGRWQPAIAYTYTDPAHANDGIVDVKVVDKLPGPPLIVGKEGTAGQHRIRGQHRADFIEMDADFIYPAQVAAGSPAICYFRQLSFGVHIGDDIATDVRLRWINTESAATVDLPIDNKAQEMRLDNIVSITSGLRHALARDRDGSIWVWGHNGYGQLGNGKVEDSSIPIPLPPLNRSARPLPPKPEIPLPPREKAPEGKVFNVREYGAKGDGITLDQKALQTLIDDCAKQEDATVWFPAGTYRTGTLVLRDHTHLHLSAGATILASTNREHFPNSMLIQAEKVHDITISGQGTIDGQGHFVGARGWRHNCINMRECRNILIEGISTVNSGAWTQHYTRCIELQIKNVTVRSLRPGRNNDGIDLSGCENVRIEGCTVISDDDAIVIKSQREERENRNIQVIGNTCHTYRGAFKLGTETRGIYKNITCRDLVCHGAKAIELYSVDGSETSGITVENVRGYDALVALNIRLGARLRSSYWAKGLEAKIGYLRDINIRNIKVEIGNKSWREILLAHNIPDAELATGRPESPYDSCISGLPGHLVENVTIENLQVEVPGGTTLIPDAAKLPERPKVYPHAGNFGTLPAYGLFVRHARNITLKNTSFTPRKPDARSPIAQFDTENLTIE